MSTPSLRMLPKIDQLLEAPELGEAAAAWPRAVVVRQLQESVGALRGALLAGNGRGKGLPAGREAAAAWVLEHARAALQRLGQPTLRRVLNATGVVLHTNLGRAPLAPAALEAIQEVARGYSNLEYDLEAGARASRMDHVDVLLAHLLGAEAAMAVNNNAAAVLLAIDTLAEAGVVVSRGEQVEIGDSFRLPEILARAGVPIHEVGTTNRTTPEDYARAAAPGSVLLKVHRSNFVVQGFTREASIAELAEVAAQTGSTLVYDLGSGSLVPYAAQGLPGEPEVEQALRDGADVVTMSGDKLLGGPQAGILAGRAEPVARLRRNPLARALRIDKLTLAALQATLLSYAREGARSVPATRLILSSPEECRQRAQRVLERLQGRVPADVEARASHASVGGGAFADVQLPSWEIGVRPQTMRATQLARSLRRGQPPVVARIKEDTVALDMRCVMDEDVPELAEAVIGALVVRGGVE